MLLPFKYIYIYINATKLQSYLLADIVTSILKEQCLFSLPDRQRGKKKREREKIAKLNDPGALPNANSDFEILT